MNKKLLTIGLPVIGAVLVAGIGIASAATALTTTSATSASATSAQGGGRMGGGPDGGFGGGMGFNSMSATDYATNQATEFQNEATALGLSVSVIEDGWAQGESLDQIATANGITATQLKTDLSTYRTNQLTAQLQALVTNGTITQAQMTTRLAFEQAQATKQQSMERGGKRGPPGSNESSTASTATSSN